MSKTIQELAKEVLNAGNACNVCGLAQSFARAMVDLGEHCGGTTPRNKHPITALWLVTMYELTGQAYEYPYAAYNEVKDLANGQD